LLLYSLSFLKRCTERYKELLDDLEKIKQELVGKTELFNPSLVKQQEKHLRIKMLSKIRMLRL